MSSDPRINKVLPRTTEGIADVVANHAYVGVVYSHIQ